MKGAESVICAKPQIPLPVLPDAEYLAVEYLAAGTTRRFFPGDGISFIRNAVKSKEASICTQPQKTWLVFMNGIHGRGGQTLAVRDVCYFKLEGLGRKSWGRQVVN